jgi:hypothetical protein
MPFKDPGRQRAAVAASMRKKRAAMTEAEKEGERVKANAAARKKYRADKEWREARLAENHAYYLRLGPAPARSGRPWTRSSKR